MKFNLGHGYDYDDTTGTINLDDEIVLRLKGTKCKILTELLKNEPGEPTSREQLIMAVWGKDDPLIYGSALTQQIHLLRKEMETIGFKNYIQSQSRKGYFISTPSLPVKNESTNQYKNIKHTVLASDNADDSVTDNNIKSNIPPPNLTTHLLLRKITIEYYYSNK